MSAWRKPCLCMAQPRANSVAERSPCGFSEVFLGPLRRIVAAIRDSAEGEADRNMDSVVGVKVLVGRYRL